MHKITEQWIQMRLDAVAFHKKLYELIAETHLQIMQGQCQIEPDLVDQGLLAREIKEWCDDLRKEAQARELLLGKIIAASTAQKMMAGDYKGEPVRGEFSTGTPNVKEQPKLPDMGTAAYVDLLMAMGVPIAVAMEAPIKMDWQKTGDWFTKRLEEGKEVPDCITKRYPVFTTQFRRVKERNSTTNANS